MIGEVKKWVAVLKSGQYVHRIVGVFDTQDDVACWIGDDYRWVTCEIELDPSAAKPKYTGGVK
jgi:hypothetical protein